MHRRLPIVLTLVAWLLGTGVQWDLVQAFGWTRMIATYSQTMSFTQAVKKTFSGEMCGICEIVSEGKRRQSDAAPLGGQRDTKVFLLLPAAPAIVFVAPESGVWPGAHRAAWSIARAAPPVPPPRA